MLNVTLGGSMAVITGGTAPVAVVEDGSGS